MRIVSNIQKWPLKLTYNDYPEGDQLIEGFIKAVEELDLFEEPSSQGGYGADFFYDADSMEELGSIDLQEETDELTRMYYESKSEEDYVWNVICWLKFILGI